MANNKLFSVGLIHNPKMDISKKMDMEVIIHKDKSFHYQFTKGKDKLNCIFGIYKTLQFSSIRDLGNTIINECSAQDVFVSGLAAYDKVEVLVPSEIQRKEITGSLPDHYITRQKHNFNWANTPGIISIDIDGYSAGGKEQYFTQEEAIDILFKAVPEFKNAPILIKPSTSSCVYYNGKARVEDIEGNQLRQEGADSPTDLTQKSGLRFYIVISSLTWLHKAKEFLETRLWNIGYGYLDYDVNGNENFRCLVDLAMYSSTDRADFIKASVDTSIDGFYQDFGELTYLNEDAPPLEVSRIKDLTREEKSWLQNNKDKARKYPDNVARQKRVKDLYLENKVKEAQNRAEKASDNGISDNERKRISKDVSNSVKRLYSEKVIDRLHPIYILDQELRSVRMITTDEIFKNEESARKYHGMYCASVLDPFYTPGKSYYGESLAGNQIVKSGIGIDFSRAKILSCNDRPSIVDQAHGGRRFFFDTEFFDIAKLERKRLNIETIKLPIYNLAKIANCFRNQYNKESISDIENFGNVLKELELEIGDLAFKVFKITLYDSKENIYKIWQSLTGYGPSLYDFMFLNTEKFKKLELVDNKAIQEINFLDVGHRLKLMSKTYTKVMLPGGDVQFITKKYDPKFGWSYDMHPKTAVMNYYHDDEFIRLNSKNDKTIKDDITKLWFRKEHKKFPNLEFFPVKGIVATNNNYVKGTSKDAFNLYTGLNLVPKPKMYEQNVQNKIVIRKGWYLLDNHIKKILCNNDDTKYEYMLNWIANMFQYPERMGETILAFQGDEGTGKNTVWDAIIKSFGSFGKNIVDGDLILGAFNETISRKILIVLNEAVWEGDVKGHGKLKSITTEPYLEISEKYKNSITVRNTLHIVIMTNHEAVAPMGTGDRRIATFDVNNSKACNREYFGKLKKELNNGGIEHFVYDMLKRDLGGFNISELPNETHSKSAVNSILNSAQPWLKWWYECLFDNELYGYVAREGSLTPDNGVEDTSELSELLARWNGSIPSSITFDSYNNWKEMSGFKNDNMTPNALTRNLKDLIVRHIKKAGSPEEDAVIAKSVYKNCKFKVGSIAKVRRCLITGSLANCREALVSKFNRKVEWIDIEDEEI